MNDPDWVESYRDGFEDGHLQAYAEVLADLHAVRNTMIQDAWEPPWITWVDGMISNYVQRAEK